MYYTARLKANVPFHLQAGGRVILVDTTGEAESIDITPMRGGQEQRKLPKRQKAFKCAMEFDSIVVLATVDCLVGLFLSMTDVSLGFADGMMLKVTGEVSIMNSTSNPVPVSIKEGSVNVTASNVGINNDLKTISDLPVVIVGTARAGLVGDPTQKRLRIRNGHASAIVAIGGAGVTLANAAVRLLPGDLWIEDDAPGATWYAVSDTADTNVQIQGMK